MAGVAKAGRSEGCAPGGLGAVVGEMAAGLYDPLAQNAQGNTVQFAGLMSSLAAALAGGSAEDIAIANAAGQNAAANNFLSAPERARMRDLEIACRSGCSSEDLSELRSLAERNLGVSGGALAGTVQGVASYFYGLAYLPDHALASYGAYGPERQSQAIAGEQAVADAIALISNDPIEAIRLACLACMNLSPQEEANLQGRLGGRLATAATISAMSGPIGFSASVGAIAGNLLSAGVNIANQVDVLRAIIFGIKQ